MPASVIKLARLVADPDTSGADYERVIAFDEALAANVLRMANSAWSKPAQPITRVRDAVMRVGAANILRIAIGARVAPMMKMELAEYELEENELWRHSVASALAAEHLGRVARTSIPPAAFTAALLHDIGKLYLGRQLGPAMSAGVRRVMEEHDVTWVEAERRIVGVTHADVGGMVARRWNFPEELANAIEHHHDPGAAPGVLCDTVHVANAVAKLIGVGIGAEHLNIDLSEAATEHLGLTATGFEELCARVCDELSEALATYDIG